jgi:outer membrane autotransporter protein
MPRARRLQHSWSREILLATLAAATVAFPAGAQNAAFQSFFFDVCGSPGGTLADRCGESGGGDLSGDSEDSLNPSQTLPVNDAALARARAVGDEVEGRLEERRDEPAPTAADVGGRWGVFLGEHWEGFDRDETSRERGFDGDTLGVQLGADYRVSERAFAGLFLAYDYTDSEFDSDQPGVAFVPPGDDGSMDADNYSVTAYGSYGVTDSFYVDGSAGYGYSDYEFRRNAVFQETTRTVPQTNVRTEADSDGHELSAGLGCGYDFRKGAFEFGPYLRAHYVRTKVDGYRESDETGSGLAMEVDSESQTSLTSIVGARASYAVSTTWGVLLPQARVEYEHEFERDEETAATRFVQDAGGNVFRVSGDDPDRDYLNASAGLVLVLAEGWMPFVDYEVLVGHSFLDRHRVALGVRKEF